MFVCYATKVVGANEAVKWITACTFGLEEVVRKNENRKTVTQLKFAIIANRICTFIEICNYYLNHFLQFDKLLWLKNKKKLSKAS